jgi:hypothetical protein
LRGTVNPLGGIVNGTIRKISSNLKKLVSACWEADKLKTQYHSDLNACTGSIEAARRAGMIPATQAATVTVAIAANTILGSALVIS